MQVLMVGALPKWRGDRHLSSVESQLPYVLVNLNAHPWSLRGTQQQVRAGAAIRNHMRTHRAPGDCRLHRIPTGRFPSPVTTRPAPCTPPRNATTGTPPSGGRHPARDRDNPLAENRPPKTTAHDIRTSTGMRHRAGRGRARSTPDCCARARNGAPRTEVRVEESRRRAALDQASAYRSGVHSRVLRGRHPRCLGHDMGNETVTA